MFKFLPKIPFFEALSVAKFWALFAGGEALFSQSLFYV